MKRLFSLFKSIFVLTLLLFLTWYLSAKFLPKRVLLSYVSGVFEINPVTNGEISFSGMLIANFITFLGIQFCNLFKVKKISGGLCILPLLWIFYGILLGTGSFIFTKDTVPISLSVLWERTGVNELVAYTVGYEATSNWALWEGFFKTHRIPDKKWRLQKQDIIYWLIGIFLLIIAMVREVA